jgi:hypothetical protein
VAAETTNRNRRQRRHFETPPAAPDQEDCRRAQRGGSLEIEQRGKNAIACTVGRQNGPHNGRQSGRDTGTTWRGTETRQRRARICAGTAGSRTLALETCHGRSSARAQVTGIRADRHTPRTRREIGARRQRLGSAAYS